MRFSFRDKPNTAVIMCSHIIDGGAPILYVSHDEDDGMWQFLCGGTHEVSEARLVSLKYAYSLDPSVGALSKMPCGCIAERDDPNAEWRVSRR